MNMRNVLVKGLAFAVAIGPAPTALADPCGMVPPLAVGVVKPITRVGAQTTYVFYKDGIESIVLRPGFEGKVDEFGMLIPFPSPPAIRKVSDDIFPHIAAAVDPPPVVVDLRPMRRLRSLGYAEAPSSGVDAEALSVVPKDEVRVIREEAVGMYEVAVLAAGGAAALEKWMTAHGFRYPTGMDDVCEEYVAERWCFVAVKARVGSKSASEPKPGMRDVDPSLKPGDGFDGHVQAMGFRFKSDELVVPMRLSAFNEGELRNVVYCLTDGPRRIDRIPARFVVRQVTGIELVKNLTELLPIEVVGGDISQVSQQYLQSLRVQRDPVPHNGLARELFASDLLAAKTGVLSHPFEEREKRLLEIGERLGLRGPELDSLHAEELRFEARLATDGMLRDLSKMTLTVVDGLFPRDVVASANLEFPNFAMPVDKNSPDRYDARAMKVKKASLLEISRVPVELWAGLAVVLVLAAAWRNRRRSVTRQEPTGA